MRVDFYQLSRDPVEQVVPQLARATLNAGERLLVISERAGQLDSISRGLWEAGGTGFLANGLASDAHAGRQPILLSARPDPVNGAAFILLADGAWRDEALSFERVFLLFGDAELEHARSCWRALGSKQGLERHFWKQEGGKWIEKA